RSAIIGAVFADSPTQLADFVRASTTLTHTDPRALTGAQAIAALTAWAIQHPAQGLLEPEVLQILGTLAHPTDLEWQQLLAKLHTAYQSHLSVKEFAERLGLLEGVSGYIYHSVPVAIYAWMRHYGNFEQTLIAVLELGGDTDTVAAIAGALAGAVVGEAGIPSVWIEGIKDWPRSPHLLRLLGDRLTGMVTTGQTSQPVRYFWPALIPRNTWFLVLVLLHALRRLAPPY
ncbi:MAG: ADP-ribosylglycohydrolase family protein, partial [Leptolyngbyaceae bacterium]|nr:ADP-ribosylglycohydrolase family protein [Leptolyngbyaceae bacterium]